MTSESIHPEPGPGEMSAEQSVTPDAAASASAADAGAPPTTSEAIADAPAERNAVPDAGVSSSGSAGEGGEGRAEVGPQGTGEEPVEESEAEEEYPDTGPVEPLELIEEPSAADLEKHWYILKVQVNREDSIREALQRRVRVAGMDAYFGEVIVPTEDVAEFNKAGKRRIVKKKLYPGYILVNMALSDESWFLVRETPGIGDFTGSAGKPSPMAMHEVEKILRVVKPNDEAVGAVRTAIPFKSGDRVRVKEGYFQNFEGEVSAIDQTHGRVTVMINIFGRPNPVELDHWQIEAV